MVQVDCDSILQCLSLGQIGMSASHLSTIIANLIIMRKAIFKTLARLNKVIMPQYSKRDINKLSKVDKALVAYRYWVTMNALED